VPHLGTGLAWATTGAHQGESGRAFRAVAAARGITGSWASRPTHLRQPGGNMGGV